MKYLNFAPLTLDTYTLIHYVALFTSATYTLGTSCMKDYFVINGNSEFQTTLIDFFGHNAMIIEMH